MQMGRWFGYRGGYHDLVRLYLERGDDWLGTWRAGVDRRDEEEAFRNQLTRYARPTGGQRPIRPIDVPAVTLREGGSLFDRLSRNARSGDVPRLDVEPQQVVPS